MSGANPTIIAGPSTTTPFRPALTVATPKASATAIRSSLPGAAINASEARYWSDKFGLDTTEYKSGKARLYAHPRKLVLQAATASVIHQVTFGPPTFSKATPLAVVGGPRVQLYGTSSHSTFHRSLTSKATSPSEPSAKDVSADRKIQTGGSLATAAAFRNDGRLLAVATEHGQVRIHDTSTRATLCTFTVPNKLTLRSVAWLRDGGHLLTGGDDGAVRIWSLMTQDISTTTQSGKVLSGHGDAVRCTAVWQASTRSAGQWPHDSLAFSAGYDKTVRIWNLDDWENAKDDTMCLSVLSHGDPVEALMVMYAPPEADVPCWLISAGGTTVKVWNPITGVCVQELDAKHRKTITCMLAMPRKNPESGDQMRVFTAGLDGLLRIHSWDPSTGKLEHLHGLALDVSVTALAVDPKGDRLAIGTVEGKVLVRQRGPSIKSKKRTRDPPAGTYAFFQRGANANPVSGDYVVQENRGKKQKLRKFDIALKQFRYGDALEEALSTRDPIVVVSVLEELGKRRGLAIALSNRDEESLEPVLAFTKRYITQPRFTTLLMGVAEKLLDIYAPVAGQSEVIDELFASLKTVVSNEVAAQQSLLTLQGQLEASLAAVADEMYDDY